MQVITVFTLRDWVFIGAICVGILFMLYGVLDFYVIQKLKGRRKND